MEKKCLSDWPKFRPGMHRQAARDCERNVGDCWRADYEAFARDILKAIPDPRSHSENYQASSVSRFPGDQSVILRAVEQFAEEFGHPVGRRTRVIGHGMQRFNLDIHEAPCFHLKP